MRRRSRGYRVKHAAPGQARSGSYLAKVTALAALTAAGLTLLSLPALAALAGPRHPGHRPASCPAAAADSVLPNLLIAAGSGPSGPDSYRSCRKDALVSRAARPASSRPQPAQPVPSAGLGSPPPPPSPPPSQRPVPPPATTPAPPPATTPAVVVPPVPKKPPPPRRRRPRPAPVLTAPAAATPAVIAVAKPRPEPKPKVRPHARPVPTPYRRAAVALRPAVTFKPGQPVLPVGVLVTVVLTPCVATVVARLGKLLAGR